MSAPTIGRGAALLGIAIFVVGACGPSGATTGPGQTATAVGTQPAATQGAAQTDGGLPTFALPSFIGDQELEDMLPDEIGGETLNVLSMTGSEFLGSGGSEEMQAMLTALGKQPSDLSVAFGGAGTVSIVAFRVKGVPAGQILPALTTAYQEEIDATTEQVSFGGKQVTKFTPTDTSEGVSYVYPTGDVVFVVGGMDAVTDEILNEVFSKLP